MARPTPVLPLVGSTIVPPGRSRPSRSRVDVLQLAEQRGSAARARSGCSVGWPEARGGRDGLGEPDERGVPDQVGHLIDDHAAAVVAGDAAVIWNAVVVGEVGAAGVVLDPHRRHPPA
jgi:hypothetical protein